MGAEPKQDRIPTADDATGTAFDSMMDSLDSFFHIAVCPNHSQQDQQDAFELARDAFIDFAYDGADPDAGAKERPTPPTTPPGISNHAQRSADDKAQNAPTSFKVH